MSQPAHYWHGMVKKMVMRYPQLKAEQSKQAQAYSDAIERAIKITAESENGDAKVEAISLVCFERKLTVEGVAQKIHYSPRTVQRWVIKFTILVGKLVGF